MVIHDSQPIGQSDEIFFEQLRSKLEKVINAAEDLPQTPQEVADDAANSSICDRQQLHTASRLGQLQTIRRIIEGQVPEVERV